MVLLHSLLQAGLSGILSVVGGVIEMLTSVCPCSTSGVGTFLSPASLANAFGSILIPAVLNGKSLENTKWLLEVGHSVAISKIFMQCYEDSMQFLGQ